MSFLRANEGRSLYSARPPPEVLCCVVSKWQITAFFIVSISLWLRTKWGFLIRFPLVFTLDLCLPLRLSAECLSSTSLWWAECREVPPAPQHGGLALLKGVPFGLWQPPYRSCRGKVPGGDSTPAPAVPLAVGPGASRPGQSAAPGDAAAGGAAFPGTSLLLPRGVCPSATANSVLVGGRERSKGKLLQFLLLWSVVAVTETPLSWTAVRVLWH